MKLLVALVVLCFSVSVLGAEAPLVAGFTNESKAGIVITTGNSKTQTYDLSQKNSYEWSSNKVGWLGSFLRAKANGIESARRWSLGLRYDRILSEQWAAFTSELMESDIYAGYMQRYSTDVGGKYTFVADDTNKLFIEAGYRFQRENQTTGDTKNLSFSRIYTEYLHFWNPTVSNKFWFEYLQNFARGEDRFFNAELSLKASLTRVLAVQLAYLMKYRQLVPTGVSAKTDTTLTAALVAQF